MPPAPPQHVWPLPPHVPQLPFAQVPMNPGQVVPEPTQVSATQQPPPVQVPPGQHADPAAPQDAQIVPVHTAPDEHWLPAQHASPGSPHV